MKKSLKVLLFFLCFIAAIYCIHIQLYWIAAFILVLCIFYLTNKSFQSKLKNNCINFMQDKRRNFDIIIIGKPLRKNSSIQIDSTKTLYLTNRKRSLFASYLILLHYYSYLREDGKGIIYIIRKKDEEKNYITIYDWIYFHPVIKSRLKMSNKLLYKIPLLYCYKKFKINNFFIDKKNTSLENRIYTFCQERYLNVKIISE